jgi:hypothetical protein
MPTASTITCLSQFAEAACDLEMAARMRPALKVAILSGTGARTDVGR